MDENANTRVICPKCGATVLHEAKFCGMCGTSMSGLKTPPNPYLGQIVAGRYRIKTRIASGGMGEVYVAKHETLAQKVAVKLLHRRFANDEQIVRRFFNEARSYCKVKHPYAVSVLDFGRLNDGTLYIVTEFVDGKPLSAVIRDSGPLAPGPAVRLTRQIAETLAAAHAEQVIHRDLKPDNIMVTAGPGQRDTVKVLDLGIARILDNDDTQRLTKTGAIFGTPEFMSPEQAEGRSVTYSSDLYALGCVMFFMLTGKPPFEAEKRADLLQKHIWEPPPLDRLREIDDVPDELVAVIEGLLAKPPEERPDDMITLLSELEPLAAILPESLSEPPESDTSDSEEAEDGDEPPADDADDVLLSGEQDVPAEVGSAFDFEIDDDEPVEDSDEYTWGAPDEDDDPLAQQLDVDPAEVPVTTLSRSGSWLPWVLVPLILVGVGLALWAIIDQSRGDIAEDRLGTGQAAGEETGTGTQAALADAGADGGEADMGTAVAPEPAGPPPLPERPFQIVHGGSQAGLAATLLNRAQLEDAAEAWERARTLLIESEEQEIDLQIARDLARAQELVATAREALEANRCRRADRAIVEMREISPALRRSFLRDLHRCNRRVEESRGRPPRTLGD